jgi:hypothetical protein
MSLTPKKKKSKASKNKRIYCCEQGKVLATIGKENTCDCHGRKEEKAKKLYREIESMFPDIRHNPPVHPRAISTYDHDLSREFGKVSIHFENSWRGRGGPETDICNVRVFVPIKVLYPDSPYYKSTVFVTKDKPRPEAMKDYRAMIKRAEQIWSEQ